MIRKSFNISGKLIELQDKLVKVVQDKYQIFKPLLRCRISDFKYIGKTIFSRWIIYFNFININEFTVDRFGSDFVIIFNEKSKKLEVLVSIKYEFIPFQLQDFQPFVKIEYKDTPVELRIYTSLIVTCYGDEAKILYNVFSRDITKKDEELIAEVETATELENTTVDFLQRNFNKLEKFLIQNLPKVSNILENVFQRITKEKIIKYEKTTLETISQNYEDKIYLIDVSCKLEFEISLAIGTPRTILKRYLKDVSKAFFEECLDIKKFILDKKLMNCVVNLVFFMLS